MIFFILFFVKEKKKQKNKKKNQAFMTIWDLKIANINFIPMKLCCSQLFYIPLWFIYSINIFKILSRCPNSETNKRNYNSQCKNSFTLFLYSN